MIWALLISSSVLGAASVSGTVQLADSRDPDARRRQDFSGVVIWLEPAGGRTAPAAPRLVKMIQKKKKFAPHVLAVPVGSTVDFPNLDPIFHNAFSNFSGQPFDVGLYPPGTSQKVQFRRAGIVRVFCNIHPTMSAVIAVLETPYMAVTAPAGAFSIDGVPAGDYMLKVFHERATEQTLDSLARRVTVQDSPLSLTALTVSETGYIPQPHMNKHGRDYPPVIVDTPAYPGRRP